MITQIWLAYLLHVLNTVNIELVFFLPNEWPVCDLSVDIIHTLAFEHAHHWVLTIRLDHVMVVNTCIVKDDIRGLFLLHIVTISIRPLRLRFDLELLAHIDSPESHCQHHTDDNQRTYKSCTIVDSLDMPILPDDVRWHCCFDKLWLHVEKLVP